MDQIDADVGNMFEKIDTWLDGFFRLLPNIALALVVLILFYFLDILISRIVRNRAEKRDRNSLGEVAGSLLRWTVTLLGFALAITIIAPSITPVTCSADSALVLSPLASPSKIFCRICSQAF